jgi:signal peptide peptidase SppA
MLIRSLSKGIGFVLRGVSLFFLGKGTINYFLDGTENQTKNFIIGIIIYLVSSVLITFKKKSQRNSDDIFDTINGVSEGNFQFYNIAKTRKELHGNRPKIFKGKNKTSTTNVQTESKNSIVLKWITWLKSEKREKNLLTEPDIEQGNQEMEKMHKRIFIIQFNGNDQAVDQPEDAKYSLPVWDELVFRLNSITEKGDEIILMLNSPGGITYEYGLAASCLNLLKKNGIVKLTVCVDRVAASGGYLMACVADEIIAAPWAILGSIGVVTFTPNIRRAADKLGIDLLQLTAGTYKRTLDPFGEVTPEKMLHVQAELDTTMHHFKDHICQYRPQLNEKIENIATGESWNGIDALKLGLIDRLGSSSEIIENYLQDPIISDNMYRVVYERNDKFLKFSSSLLPLFHSFSNLLKLRSVQWF